MNLEAELINKYSFINHQNVVDASRNCLDGLIPSNLQVDTARILRRCLNNALRVAKELPESEQRTMKSPSDLRAAVVIKADKLVIRADQDLLDGPIAWIFWQFDGFKGANLSTKSSMIELRDEVIEKSYECLFGYLFKPVV